MNTLSCTHRPALLTLFLAVVSAVAISEAAQAQRPPRFFRWRNILEQPAEWFGSAEAQRIADNMLLYQHSNGGWPKNIDMSRPLTDEEQAQVVAERDQAETLIDNGATYTQIWCLARVYAHHPRQEYSEAIRRGLEYLLEAQYDNGGWPMVYPLREGYYTHITFNDGAMTGVMRLLRAAASGEAPFDFLDAELRERAQVAVDKGLEVILKCQVEVDGQLTGWCAQHDEHDFSPQGARSYELPSLSGMEGVDIVEYLMELDDPSPEVKRAIQAAVAWFESAQIEGQRVEWLRDENSDRRFDRVVVEDPDAPPLWARFYEIGTNRPMFVGRDGVVRDHLADIEQERRTRYVYLGPFATELLAEKYPAWHDKWLTE